ncbi:molecular chaperone TorD family protein [Granulosicoccus sp.]|nr:molecular chaperone TorD family protein [Granulosicoccus sp.]MDB4224287.1 molecular chaperone TorD family protein [Granulosicoccus sp.]
MTSDRPVLSVKSEHEFQQDQAQAMRAAVYELLASLLAKQPDDDTLQRLRNIGDVDASEGQIAMGWELMKQASLKFDLEAVHDEYFSLFLGVGRGELVPFGSWYITGFLMEKPVAVLRSELIRLGIERQEGVVESEDHIAALCDAMALIIRSSEEISLETQQQFFNDHLAPWVGRFFNDMQNAKAAHFMINCMATCVVTGN